MYSKMKILIPVLAMTLILSGCGDLAGSKVKKRGLGGDQFALSCKLDMNEFSNIMTKNISRQIRCLGESLNLFIKVVKSGKPGYLSRVQLESYLADFRPDVKPDVVRALGAVFQIGHLITGEDRNYISKETVDKVVEFAIVFNQEAALNFGPIFENDSPVTYNLHQSHREIVSSSSKVIVQSLRKIFNPNRNGQIHKLDIVNLLESFTTDENRDDIEIARKVLFAKRILLGGDSFTLTHTELEKVILNFDRLLLIALDGVRYKHIILKQESILQLLKRDVNELYDIIAVNLTGSPQDPTAKPLFTIDEAIEGIKPFIDENDFDIEEYRVLIGEAKKLAMTGNSNDVYGTEMKKLFDHGKSILQSGTVFHRIYDKFKVQLNSPQAVNIDFSEYRYTYPEHQKELDQFERIVKKYRFMRGEYLSAYYTRGYKRNADAIFEIALFEYIIKLAFVEYGSPSPNSDSVGGYSIDKDQLQKLILKFENELINMDILTPQKAISTADNISLLGSLFQYQSDKNKVMDVNEATEFGVSLFTAISISEDLDQFMRDQNCSTDQFDRYEPGCVRKNFWKGLCKYYRSYYPLMFDSMNAPAKCSDWENTPEQSVFLDRLVEAARTCNYYTDGQKEEIHYSKGDFMTILLAMSHVETTILRWDINNNNIMDANEVMNAYEIYSPALDGFLEDKSPIIKKFKKQIYQFMIKYEKVPDEKDFGSIWKFVKFLVSFNKKAPASRKTIASILVAIGEQNKKMQTTPQFNCNLLRDPENIPREPFTVLKEVDTREDFSSILKPYLYLAD